VEIFINELSSGVYEVVARDATGPRFRTTGADPDTLIETARAWVRGLSRMHELPFVSFVFAR
jgi:hypothetical protein